MAAVAARCTAVLRVDRSDRMLASVVRIVNPGGNAGAAARVSYEDPATLFADEIARGMAIASRDVSGKR